MISIKDLAALLKAEIIFPSGQENLAVTKDLKALAPIASAAADDVTFLANDDYEKYLTITKAACIIVKRVYPGLTAFQLVHANPYWAFAKAAQIFFPPKKHSPGISSQATIAKSAVIGEGVTVFPHVYIGERAVIGENVVLYPGVYIGDDCRIGDNSILRANVVCEDRVVIGKRALIHAGSVLGADGFGFAPGEGEVAKIPQIGGVRIGDDVEIGGLSTIDRGALEDTEVGNGTKLDSHVHIGHGVKVGNNSMLCAFSGIAGSARLGNWVVTGGHSAVGNRVVLADGVQLGAMSAMTKNADEKGAYLGFPAIPQGEWRRQVARVRKLADFEEKLKDLSVRVRELEK